MTRVPITALISSVRRAFRLWLGHKKNFVDRSSEGKKSLHITNQMSNKDAVHQNGAVSVSCNLPARGQHNFTNAAYQPAKGCALEVNERGVSASNAGYPVGNARNEFNGFLGFIGHDGRPEIRDETRQCSVPGEESNLERELARC